MAQLEPAIVEHLLDDSNVTALIGDRLYPVRITQNVQPPCVAYRKIDVLTDHAYRTANGLSGTRIRFDCFAKSVKESKTIAEKLVTSLDGLIDTILGVAIHGTLYLDEFDGYNDEAKLFVVSVDFRFWHNNA